MNTSRPQIQSRREGRHLVLESVIDATPHQLWRCWTEPALMLQWFAPLPWTTVRAETDLRVGGANLIVMRGPDGNEFPSRGVYLDLVPDRLIVFTDAYTEAWLPSERPFFTGVIEFADAGDGHTRYTARALHWSDATCDEHEKMGFHEGWALCTRQLAALAAKV